MLVRNDITVEAVLGLRRVCRPLPAALIGASLLTSLSFSAFAAKISAVHSPGAVIVGYDNTTCSSTAGAIRYNSSNTSFEFCNGSSWATFTSTTPTSGTIGGSGGLYVQLVNGTAASGGIQFKNQAGTGLFLTTGPTTFNMAYGGSAGSTFDASGNYNESNDYLIGGSQVMFYPGGSATNSIGLGVGSLYSGPVTGDANIGVGTNTLKADTSGRANIAIGTNAAAKLTTGGGNVAIGRQALDGGAITNNNNVAVGDQALLAATTTADSNVAFGAGALSSLTTDVSLVAFGYNALASATVTPNTAFGYQAGQYVGGANWNILVGANAGRGVSGNLSTNGGLTAVGANANSAAQGIAQDNISLGGEALMNDTNDNMIIAIGSNALTTETVNNSQTTVVGAFAGANVADNSGTAVAVGMGAYRYVSGGNAQSNTAIGVGAMAGTAANNFTGNQDTAAGYNAMTTLQSGTGNAAAGYQAMASITSGYSNTAIGYQAGYAGTAITTEDDDVFVGYQAGASASGYVNSVAIGNGARVIASNSVILGNGSITTLYSKQPLTSLSDRRHKRDIVNLSPDLGLNFINRLQPVSYRYNNGDETLRYGFIAQDLEKALPQVLQDRIENAKDASAGVGLVERGNDKDRTYRAGYGELVAPIVQAIKDQQARIRAIRLKIDAAKARQTELRKQIVARTAAIKTLQAENSDMRAKLADVAAGPTQAGDRHD